MKQKQAIHASVNTCLCVCSGRSGGQVVALHAYYSMECTRSVTTRSSWKQRIRCACDDQYAVGGVRIPRRTPSWLIGGAVERRHWADPEVKEFLRLGRPVVLTGGCPLVRELVGKWDFDHLADGFGSFDKLPVHFAPREVTEFSRIYGEGLGKGGVSHMSFRRFATMVREQHLAPRASDQSPAPLRYYLQTPLLWNEGQDGENKSPHGLSPETDNRPLASAPFGESIKEDMRKVGWEWLRHARDVCDSHPFDTCQMWVGHGGGSTPLHFDSINNFLAQVKGRKQILLFPPAQTWRVYPFPLGHPKDNFAMVNVEDPDVERFPSLKRARALEAILSPGEVLWLPRFYWHYVHQLDAPSENISLNFWHGQKGTQQFMRNVRESPLPQPREVEAAASAAAQAYYRSCSSTEEAEQVAARDDALIEANDEIAMACLHAGRMIEQSGQTKAHRPPVSYQHLTVLI
jgi:hypothetical protein